MHNQSLRLNKKLRSTVMSIAILTIVLLFMQAVGCSLSTRFIQYDISKSTDTAPNGVSVYLHFSHTRHNEIRFPGIYDIDTFRDPYRLYFTIQGPFEELLEIESSIIVDGNLVMPIPLDVSTLNTARKLYPRDRGPYFHVGPFPMDAISYETKTIRVITTFTAVENGVKRTFKIKNNYMMKVYDEIGNRWLSRILSI